MRAEVWELGSSRKEKLRENNTYLSWGATNFWPRMGMSVLQDYIPHIILTIVPAGRGLWWVRIYRWGNCGVERVSNFFKSYS